ncbi:GNAT family N-acetyltransferase [Neobacillus sp. PS3-34]|uniref:GNAT family N-acetyltransferase n=1 Tax=Neobacillus sp. PS3-34 TaxID=3070678 RepID=UPI0027E0D5DA|nr:GNAT family N-acetyltransferase [Neobacillus sp. PS3-34]WML50230.1 GNAT family N-acetyltransferase [Neobacillus sp. PS3-34]
MDIVVRRAKLIDVKQMANVYVSSWKSTYRGIFSDKFLDSLTPESRYEQWRKNIEEKDNIVLVLEKDNELVGLAVGAGVKVGEYPGYDGDVTAIYFEKHNQGKGYGKQLLNGLFEMFKEERGYTNSIVKVVADNESRYFYEKMGAKLIDEQPLEEGKTTMLLTYAWNKI